MSGITWDNINDGTTELDRVIHCYKATDMELVAYIVNKDNITGIKKELMVGKYAPMYNNFGIYFLIGKDESGRKSIYVGRGAERNIPKDGELEGFDRVKEHVTKNDWYFDYWDTCIYVTNVGNNMDYGTMVELERVFIHLVKYSSGNNIHSLNRAPGNIGNVPKTKWMNTYNAIMSLLSMGMIDCKLADTHNIKASTDIINEEIIESSIINSYNIKSKNNLSDEDTQKLERYKQIELYDSVLGDLKNNDAIEYKGRIYTKSKYTSYNTIYGKKSEMVITPEFIVQEMVGKIPKDVFRSNSKFLCIASKDGKYARELIKILMSDDAELPINKEEQFTDRSVRLKHIVENMIYIVCESVELTRYTMSSILDYIRSFDKITNPNGSLLETFVSIPNIQNVFNLRNIIKERGTLYTERVILEQFGLYSGEENMKFDVVLGNPPYNNGIDVDFVWLSCHMAKEYVSMIVPGKWQTYEGSQKVSSNNTYAALTNEIVPKMKSICYFPDCYDIFDIKEIDGITYFLLDINNTDDTIEIENRCKLQPALNSVVNRSLKYGDTLWNIGDAVVKSMGQFERLYLYNRCSGRYAVNINSQASPGGGGFLTKEQNSAGKWVTKAGIIGNGGMLLNFNSRNITVIGKTDIIDMENPSDLLKASGTSNIVFQSDSLDECKSFVSFINRKLVRFNILIALSKLTILDNHTFRFVPAPPNGKFDHIFTDKELYEYFKIPAEYIEIIESIIKEKQ